jgi:hypothetical protein
MLKRPPGRPKNRREDDIRNDVKKLETASRIVISGNDMLRGAKH